MTPATREHDGGDHGSAEHGEPVPSHRSLVGLRLAREQGGDDATGDEPVRLQLVTPGLHVHIPITRWARAV